MKSVIKMIIGLSLLALLTACASSANLQSTWRSPDTPATSYKKLLVVGITHNKMMRKSFENIFSDTLRKHGVSAVSSLTLITDNSQVSRAQMLELVKQTGADAVVITRVLSKSEKDNANYATGSFQRRTVAMSESDGDSSTTAVMSTVGFVPGEITTGKATLETLLFDTASTNLVWTAQSKVAGLQNQENAILWKLSAELTKALGKEKLVELNGKNFEMPSL
jgi:hypothetical protein